MKKLSIEECEERIKAFFTLAPAYEQALKDCNEAGDHLRSWHRGSKEEAEMAARLKAWGKKEGLL